MQSTAHEDDSEDDRLLYDYCRTIGDWDPGDDDDHVLYEAVGKLENSATIDSNEDDDDDEIDKLLYDVVAQYEKSAATG